MKPTGYFLAVLWTWAWGLCRSVRQILRHATGVGDMKGCTAPLRLHIRWAWVWGRRDSPEPIVCEECGWGGPRRWTIHTYRGCGICGDDVEPIDECPRCGREV